MDSREALDSVTRGGAPPDHVEVEAIERLRRFFDAYREKVFSARQIEVRFEDDYFHWITERALRDLADEGRIKLEQRKLAHGAPINFVWHRSNRYTRRPLTELLRLVNEYSHPDFTAALGNTGELLVSDGFGRFGFVQAGRNTREYRGRRWTASDDNLDFIFEKDGRSYGVEVKNTLPYIRDSEFRLKMDLCDELGVMPVFVVRQMPRIWISEVAQRGGFALILKFQLYPLSHRAFAETVRVIMDLPVDAPKALYDGTMQRFLKWHEKQLGS